MIVDSDVLIWYMRGHAHARKVVDGLGAFRISAVTYMEEMIPGLALKAFRPD